MSAAGVYARFPALALRRGRDFAAWLGVVPRQYSTGGKQKLFGMSKRGNIYLRRMGAASVAERRCNWRRCDCRGVHPKAKRFRSENRQEA